MESLTGYSAEDLQPLSLIMQQHLEEIHSVSQNLFLNVFYCCYFYSLYCCNQTTKTPDDNILAVLST